MHCRVPITNSLFMMFKFFDIFFSYFEKIITWEGTTWELPTFYKRTLTTTARIITGFTLCNLEL